jgi:predicted dehydrogenase
VRIAFLGTGLASELHTKTLRAVAGTTERWYASRDAARAQHANARFAGAGSFSSYDAALASPQIDAVIIALPPALHLEWAMRALEAGKHVVLEKPPLLKSSDFAAVAAAAGPANRQVLVAENYFYKPLTSTLRDTIGRGDFGDLRFIQLNALKRQTTGNWRDDGSLSGGGALFEGGIHWISLLASLGLTVRRVRAARPGSATGLERNISVTLEYAEGPVATLAYSWDVGSLVNGIRWSRCYGTAGTLRFETNGLVGIQSGRRKRLVVPGLRDLLGYRAMWADFLGAMEANRPPAYSLALAERDLRLVEAAYASLDGQAS